MEKRIPTPEEKQKRLDERSNTLFNIAGAVIMIVFVLIIEFYVNG